MKRFLLSGGNAWSFDYAPMMASGEQLQGVYGFEHMFAWFDPAGWTGKYIQKDMVLNDLSALDGVDLWIISLDYTDMDDPRFLPALHKAREMGVTIGGEPNGGHHLNFTRTKRRVIDFWQIVDFMTNSIDDPDSVAVWEKLFNKPYFGLPVPYDRQYMEEELLKAEAHKWDVRPDIGECFVFGHELTDWNMVTVQIAEAFGIKLIVDVYHAGKFKYADAYVNAINADGGFRHVCFTRGFLDHYLWLYQFMRSRGLFYLTYQPSAGRPMIYAGAMKKLCLASRSAWQQILHPGYILEPYFTTGAKFAELAERQQHEVDAAYGRMEEYSVEKCRGRIDAFLERHFERWR